MSHGAADGTLLDRLVAPDVPLDLAAVVGHVAVAVAFVFAPGVYGSALGAVLGLPALFFAPGYALVSLLFPGTAPDDAAPGPLLGGTRASGLGGTERLALGFGISLALLPILAVGLAVSPWAIAPVTALLSVAGLTVAFAAGAAVRRLRRPADRRFSVPVEAWVADVRRAFGGSRTGVALNVGLAAAVVLALATVGFAVAAPGPGQSYTEVSLLARNDTGELVAAGYPQEFERGESRPVVVEVANREGERTEYAVVVELQRVRQASDGGAEVLEDRRLATFTPTVGPGETWRTRHDVTPTMTGEGLRLTYLVYRGEVPDDPTADDAYRRVHVWIDVTE